MKTIVILFTVLLGYSISASAAPLSCALAYTQLPGSLGELANFKPSGKDYPDDINAPEIVSQWFELAESGDANNLIEYSRSHIKYLNDAGISYITAAIAGLSYYGNSKNRNEGTLEKVADAIFDMLWTQRTSLSAYRTATEKIQNLQLELKELEQNSLSTLVKRVEKLQERKSGLELFINSATRRFAHEHLPVIPAAPAKSNRLSQFLIRLFSKPHTQASVVSDPPFPVGDYSVPLSDIVLGHAFGIQPEEFEAYIERATGRNLSTFGRLSNSRMNIGQLLDLKIAMNARLVADENNISQYAYFDINDVDYEIKLRIQYAEVAAALEADEGASQKSFLTERKELQKEIDRLKQELEELNQGWIASHP